MIFQENTLKLQLLYLLFDNVESSGDYARYVYSGY